MSRVWYTSDLHFGHNLAAAERIPPGIILPAVVGADIEWHNASIMGNWRRAVADEDIIYVCGDISSGSSAAQKTALTYLSHLPGRKILVPGNHDGVHGSQRDSRKWATAYREVFEDIQPFQRVRFADPEGGHINALLSHFPYTGDAGHSDHDRYTQYRLFDEGLPIIHGHVHSKEKVSRSAWGTLQIHVGLDAWDLKPVSHEEIQKLILDALALT